MKYLNMLAITALKLQSSIDYSEANPHFAFCKSISSRFSFYKNHSSTTKVAQAVLLSIGLVMASACSTIAGAYSDDPYGPVVDCDSNLPMNELLKCVDEEYAKKDAVYEHPFVKDDKIFQNKHKGNYIFFPTSYTKISKFNSIKDCYNKDLCQFKSVDDGRGLVNYDEFNDQKFRVENGGRGIMGEIYINRNHQFGPGLPAGWFSSFVGNPNKYIRSYKNPNKDIIIAKKNNQRYLYVPLIENIKLKDDKSLIVANIERFCPPDLKNKAPIANKKVYLGTKSDACGVYRFAYLTQRIDGDILVQISLDKRTNPKKIYLKIDNDMFDVDINNQGETK